MLFDGNWINLTCPTEGRLAYNSLDLSYAAKPESFYFTDSMEDRCALLSFAALRVMMEL